MRNPTAIPKAKTHIPISNGGQLQTTKGIIKLEHRLPIKRLQIEWPILHKKSVTDHDDNKDNIIHVRMSVMMMTIDKKFRSFTS